MENNIDINLSKPKLKTSLKHLKELNKDQKKNTQKKNIWILFIQKNL